MRPVNEILAERLASTEQTIANKANPRTSLKISRPEVPLRDADFIEKVKIRTHAGIIDSDVDVCHPKFGKADEEIWVAYIEQQVLYIKHAPNKEVLSKADWTEYSFTASAYDCAICFNSTPKRNTQGEWEYVTDREPWVFWRTPEGQLKARKCTPLGAWTYTLAEGNVTDVSAVRGPAGERGLWDFGLTVFFLMGGQLFYRQLIDGTWYDAELVQTVPDVTLSKIAAFRTWDYRVGLQILDTNGDLYELYTHTEGIGARNVENIEVSVKATAKNSLIEYHEGQTIEHLDVSASATGDLIYGLSAVPVEVHNVEDEDEDWGRAILIEMDYPCTEGAASEFVLRDSQNVRFNCESVECQGNYIKLIFTNFNLSGTRTMTVTYTKGTLLSPATETDSFSISFVPENLEPPQDPIPEFDSAEVDADGEVITVTLTEDIITDDISGLKDNFSVSLYEYPYTPEGVLTGTTRSVESITKGADNELILTLDIPNISSAIGDVTVHYDGAGILEGAGGPVQAFNGTFTPAGLTWKGHQNDVEHLDVSASAIGTLTKVYYHDGFTKEHIDVSAGATATLTHVGDL
jgi:hypothetical protein